MNNKVLYVLVLLPNLRPSNGVSSFIMNYFRRLDHARIHIDFALYYDRETPYYDEIMKISDSKIFILESVRSYKTHIMQCRSILGEGHYDVIHDHTLLISWPMMNEAKKMGIPVRVLHSHNSKLGETRYKLVRNTVLLPYLKKTANRFAACSNDAGRVMFGSEPFTVIPNIIDETKYKFDHNMREKIRYKYGVHGKKVILTVGRVAEQKNPFFAVDVIEQLAKIDDIEYWWIGSGPLDEKLQKYVKAKNLEHIIRIFGNQNDVIDYYQAADLFFLPSLFEGLAIVIIEAQALGLPCVISDVITDEVIYTDLVKKYSLQKKPSEWAFVLNEILKNKENRHNYNEALKQSTYSSKNAQETLLALYDWPY